MDKAQHRRAIKQVLQNYAKFRPSHGDIRLDVLFDETNDRYALMQSGWDRGRRVRGNLIYIVILDGRVVIEYDGIERGISDDLFAAGVAESDIILAFLDEPEVA